MSGTVSGSSGGSTKRAWKLQEFVAHGSNVNCLALGHKSGRVLVTGGDDKKVNLWAVGKPNCIMSLSGHTTPVECVRFGHTEELVCAGSQNGALKIWDLEAARLARTLTGHKAGLTCLDFHPYGDFLATGSTDTNIKVWDIRRKGCIFTYKGHSLCVNALKFSPDGQWVASAGEEGAVKIWDLRVGKLMTEFNEHGGPVHDVEFHPHEFLLASASRDKTVNFWDLESFQLVSTSEKDTGPVRCITFHPESECLFSASHDSFKVHLWEPHRVCDSITMGWGKIRDIAVASTQLIGASFQMSNVSIYVVDLRRVQPMCGSSRSKLGQPQAQQQQQQQIGNGNAVAGPTFKAGQHVRRSFVKEKPGVNGEKPRSQMKISEEHNSDKSGTDPEDSDAANGAANVNVTDVNNYEHIFRPRRRELNRTPTRMDDDEDEPFEAPSGSESETPTAAAGAAARPGTLRLIKQGKKPSPSPTRRSSQSAAPYAGSPEATNRIIGNGNAGANGNGLRVRRTSNNSGSAPQRPLSIYDPAGNGGISPTRNMRSTSVQPRSAAELDYRSGGDISPPVPDPHLRAQSLQRVQQQHPSPYQPPPGLTPVSRIQIGGSSGQPDRLLERPLDRPTLVRPNRASLQNLTDPQGVQQFYHSQSVDEYYHGTPPHQHQPPPQQHMRSRLSQPDLHHSNHNSRYAYEQQQQQQGPPQQAATPADQEKFEVIPMNADKPCGIEMNEFLPKKLQQALSVSNATENYSRFSAYKGYQQDGTLSESEVTSSILKGHESMMAVLATRGRNIEILHKLWQNKDAKTAVDQAVSLNDQAVLVDLLSVITLRPSIWNLDLCTALLPPIGELLQSKYEMYINTGCGAMKLILKNFASVIKTNIDSPIQTVGVDISREERHNKCMECYKDLVKIRSLILKRQTMQGKMGHTYRELSILMQYLD